jgi:hypothetical protein
MALLAYRISAGSPPTLSRVRQIALAGTRGPFCRHVQSLLHAQSQTLPTWQLSEQEILDLLPGLQPAAAHALVVDLKPSDRAKVSLFRVLRVWGWSYESWTPIALRLRELYGDEPQADPSSFKRSFPLPGTPKKELVHEFLYLRGGTVPKTGKDRGRDWTWGPVGSVNAALLWPPPFQYFVKQIKETPEPSGA